MKIAYREIKMGTKNKERLFKINSIIERYQEGGYTLTLRQLYYQLVVENVIPNKVTEYQKLSILLKEGRMAGIVDWNAIEDRLRFPSKPSSWETPASIMRSVIYSYRNDRQKGQETYLEVWVEKDALSGVLKRVTEPLGVPIVVNRGYSSATAMHDAYNRFKDAHNYNGQKAVVLYLGDFDPSGLDMIRDIERRIGEFVDGGDYPDMDFSVVPIALTDEQIKRYNPPKNPAKMKDPRAPEYVRNYGYNSWEVDALPPEVLHELLDDELRGRMDMDIYDEVLQNEKRGMVRLQAAQRSLENIDDISDEDEDDNN